MSTDNRIFIAEEKEFRKIIREEINLAKLTAQIIAEMRMEKEQEPKEFLTRNDVMRILKISSATLAIMQKERKINFLKNGRKVLFTQQDIDEYLQKNNAIMKRVG